MRPTEGYISYIVNPKAGASSQKQVSQKFYEYLIDKGFDVRLNYTDSLEHAYGLASESAAALDCRLVVAVGGDGTAREIAHGLEGSDRVMLLVPAGTENLLANELGFDEKFQTVIDTFDAGFIRPLDLGSINSKCFTSIAGFGFDGQVVKSVHSRREGNISHLDYFWPLWRTFWDYRFQSMKVEVDGEELCDGPCLVFVGNISRYAAGLHILRYADYGDGLLDVCIYKCGSKSQLLKHSAMTLLKKHSYGGDVIYKQGKHILISSEDSDIPSQIDGDPGPALPADIHVIPHAVKMMVPEHTVSAGIRTRIVRAIG